jgi:ABC-2 type transport system permease protein
MLKVLLKKQFLEVFKSYFYDAKKNKMRSKGAIIGWFVFFVVIMVGMLGGIFASMALSLCGGLVEAGMDWLYFLLMSGVAVFLGVFGSVFNTYSSLYLSKDNDLLLSMPIPVRTIMIARLLNVYLMGAMYSAVVLIPALVVYWHTAGATAANAICALALLVIVTVSVLLLSCLLGWVVARISLKLKNKSYFTVLLSLLFLGGYYFVYFKANALIQQLLVNAETYGEKIKGAAYALYLFGRIGEGDLLCAALFLAAVAILFALTWIVLSRSFLRIATASAGTGKARYTEKRVQKKSPYAALLGKEFGRLTSSANYMLNCGLGVLLIPSCGVLLLIKGRMFCDVIGEALSGRTDSAAVLVCAALCMLSCMNDMAAPSVSLEGKCLWIPQSLPVEPKTALRAKASVQLILTGLPMLFAAVCAAIVVPASAAVKALLCVAPLTYAAFSAVFGTVVGVRMPLLEWTNEVVPIKQSGAVMIAMFGGWAVCAVFAGLYLLVGYMLGAAAYLLIWSVLFAAAGIVLLRWLDRKGAAAFAAL